MQLARHLASGWRKLWKSILTEENGNEEKNQEKLSWLNLQEQLILKLTELNAENH